MKDRIRRIMESQHATQQEFADQLKIAPATLSGIFNGRTRPTLAIVDAIKNRYPQISTDWLMFGKGSMLASSSDGAKSVAVGSSQQDGDKDSDVDNAECGMRSDGAVQSGDGGCVDFVETELEKPESCTENVSVRNREMGRNGLGMVVKKSDTSRRRSIVEIRVFYDDQTWETFVPKGL